MAHLPATSVIEATGSSGPSFGWGIAVSVGASLGASVGGGLVSVGAFAGGAVGGASAWVGIEGAQAVSKNAMQTNRAVAVIEVLR